MAAQKKSNSRAVISVIGADKPGIVAAIATFLANKSVNICEMTQSVVDGVFTMTMIVDMTGSSTGLSDLAEQIDKVGREVGVTVHVHDEAIIKAIHRV